jgi:hypothetical protein
MAPAPRTAPATLKPAKDKSIERIDGILALIMAIGHAIVVQEQALLQLTIRQANPSRW